VYCYEFEDPGTRLKTFVVWRRDTLKPESISVRTAQYDSIAIDTNGSPRTSRWDATGTGRAKFWCDSVPRYFQEVGDTTRPDIIVDSTWIYPTNPDPRAGEGVWFYARLKNVGNASLSSSIWNSVTFQVDGVSKKTYQIQRTLNIGDTVTLGASPPGGGASDWQATWGDHLIRAWADSADRYVELREDNNTKYLWKHFQPKVSVVINNDHKYTNHLANDTVSVTINGNTSPNPDSTYFRHESGSWTKIGHVTSFDTLVTYSGNGVGYDSVLIFQGADTALAGDSIIVDADAPFVDITSPIQNQTVSGLVPFVGWSWDYQDHDSLWQIYVDGSPWVSGNSKIGENPMMGLPDTFGTWDSRTVANGWRWHQLRSTDAATNLAKDSVKVKVSNHQTNNGDSWASDFGTYSSPVMNVATDPGGNFYIAETQNSKVRKYSPRKDSLFAFSVKRGNDSTGTTWATAIVLKDSSTIWIADGYAHCIKKFDRQGNLLLRFGSFGSDTSRFKQPCGIALDKKGRLWVSDRLNNRIQVFDSTGHYLFQFGTQGQDSGKFNSPTGITITPNGLVWVSDTRNNQIQVFDSLGQYLKTIKAVDSLGLDTPLGICSDKWGDVFIADAHHNRIVELNPYGERILDFGGLGDSLWQFRTPIGVASSPGAHYLYVADMGNRRVQRFWVIQDDTLGGGGPQSKDAVRLPPKVTYLSQSYPNPATGKAVIEYGLAKENDVRLVIYNVAGQVVRDYNQGKQKAWYYSITWDGRSNRGHKIGAGIYFYRLEAGTWVKTRKMVVIR
jgi:sugar lactone lactonase YvrE